MAEFFIFPSGQKPLMLKSGPLLSDPEDVPVYLDPNELRKRYGPASEARLLELKTRLREILDNA